MTLISIIQKNKLFQKLIYILNKVLEKIVEENATQKEKWIIFLIQILI